MPASSGSRLSPPTKNWVVEAALDEARRPSTARDRRSARVGDLAVPFRRLERPTFSQLPGRQHLPVVDSQRDDHITVARAADGGRPWITPPLMADEQRTAASVSRVLGPADRVGSGFAELSTAFCVPSATCRS